MNEFEDEPTIWERMKFIPSSYNSVIDEQVVGVATLIYEARENDGFIYCDDIAVKLGMTPEHVELIQQLLASVRYDDRPHLQDSPFTYGVSPRGLFVDDQECADRFMADCAKQLASWDDDETPPHP